jgi:CHAT domain-containing protein
VSFHQRYAEGMDAAAALRAAQLRMLHSGNPDLESAMAWAPFQVIGYASSPSGVRDPHKGEPP